MGLLIGLCRAHRLLRAFHPDLIHGHTFFANIVVRLLKIDTPALCIVNTIHNVYEGGWLRMLAYRCTDRLSQCTTAVSAAAAQRYIRLKALHSEKCLILHNGIETDELVPVEKKRIEIRDKMGAQAEFIWLAAGRVVPAKDYPNLLRAFACVQAAFPLTQLWSVGEWVGPHPASLFAAEGGAMPQVRWLGLRRDLPALLDAADGFVLSSAWEGMPLVVGEAMAMEKPVVATDVGGVRELVGEAGVVVPARNPEILAQAMLRVMESTERRAMGHAARARILKNFQMDAKADEWEALYLSLLKRTPKSNN